ncbi:hypothetical protein ACFOG5_04370 [Pedobacter fastidiosus]|uniref:RteC protein n=1 Tax=Pedobacter fastidiosus TaxID=2765361 RepID=A0ABR7KN25_9SPHI|nr:hypothetical protein [Pedobacter fastidiosus]MBC6109487.1 hypothetical protein [Pedobacter fastidiosus]
MDIAKLIASSAKHFPEWDKMIDEHLDARYNILDKEEKELERIFYQSNEFLMSIANNFFSFANFKDSWDNSKCYMNVYGQNILLRSEKMDTVFQWGLENDQFYLESYIICGENLRYMTDDFYALLMELKYLGDFEFLEMRSLTKEERPFFENKTSSVFQLIRNFMLYQTEKMNGSNYQQPENLELGQFILKWDAQLTDWPSLIEKASRAFKILYNINYRLWKISDIANKKSKG